MSELTPCNYCTLQRIKRNAIRDGKVVTVLPGGQSSLLDRIDDGDRFVVRVLKTVPPVTVQPKPGPPPATQEPLDAVGRRRNRLGNGLPRATPLPHESPEDSPVLISLLIVLLTCFVLLLLFHPSPPPGPLR